jgi:hypothetical protein
VLSSAVLWASVLVVLILLEIIWLYCGCLTCKSLLSYGEGPVLCKARVFTPQTNVFTYLSTQTAYWFHSFFLTSLHPKAKEVLNLLVTDEDNWALFYLSLHESWHNLLNELVQIANKVWFQEKLHYTLLYSLIGPIPLDPQTHIYPTITRAFPLIISSQNFKIILAYFA